MRLTCCCCSEWEAPTLFGNRECFPCLSPSASSPAALSVYKRFSAIVLLHGMAAGAKEAPTGALHFLSLFNNPALLVSVGDIGPGHSSCYSAPPSIQTLKWIVSRVKLIISSSSVHRRPTPLPLSAPSPADEPLLFVLVYRSFVFVLA